MSETEYILSPINKQPEAEEKLQANVPLDISKHFNTS